MIYNIIMGVIVMLMVVQAILVVDDVSNVKFECYLSHVVAMIALCVLGFVTHYFKERHRLLKWLEGR